VPGRVRCGYNPGVIWFRGCGRVGRSVQIEKRRDRPLECMEEALPWESGRYRASMKFISVTTYEFPDFQNLSSLRLDVWRCWRMSRLTREGLADLPMREAPVVPVDPQTPAWAQSRF
jgi:hypothetical protein